jgi:hypothetical protein
MVPCAARHSISTSMLPQMSAELIKAYDYWQYQPQKGRHKKCPLTLCRVLGTYYVFLSLTLLTPKSFSLLGWGYMDQTPISRQGNMVPCTARYNLRSSTLICTTRQDERAQGQYVTMHCETPVMAAVEVQYYARPRENWYHTYSL